MISPVRVKVKTLDSLAPASADLMLKNPTAFSFPVAPANLPVPLFTTAKPVILMVVGAAPSSAQTFADVSMAETHGA